ncbi:MAG: nuclear transport factor 2 family protein [Acidimicrobiales bacterium]
MIDHPNADLVRALFSAFEKGNIDAIQSRLSARVVWHTPGDSILSGTFTGRDEVVRQLARNSQLTNETFRLEVLDVMAGDDHAAAVFNATAKRDGRILDLEHALLFRIEQGKITSVWSAPLDLEAFDTFWGPSGPSLK